MDTAAMIVIVVYFAFLVAGILKSYSVKKENIGVAVLSSLFAPILTVVIAFLLYLIALYNCSHSKKFFVKLYKFAVLIVRAIPQIHTIFVEVLCVSFTASISAAILKMDEYFGAMQKELYVQA